MSLNKSASAVIFRGMRDGVPIGLGYFAVAFSLGIAAHSAGIHPVQGFWMSVFNHASAGEYAGISAIRTHAGYWEIALLILIANARYLLMSTALSQKLSPEMPLHHRLLIGFGITDELFGLSINYPGYLNPWYYYGAVLTTIPLWACGTAMGIVAGNLLPALAVASLSASIYGMFIAIVVPPARKNRAILITVLVSAAASCLFAKISFFSGLSESLRIILLTVIISAAAAAAFPISDEVTNEEEDT